MRNEDDLSLGGRPNSYFAQLGAELAAWRAARKNMVHLDDDVLEGFPDPAKVNEALRIVIKLAALVNKPKPEVSRGRKSKPKPPKRKSA